MRTRVLSLVALAFAAQACGGNTVPSSPVAPTTTTTAATAYLSTVTATMAANSINRARIDWPGFNAQVLAAAPGTGSIAESAPAIRTALGLLHDRHSFFQWADGSMIANPEAPVCRAADATVSGAPADIGYVQVGTLFGPNAPAPTAYADAIHASIRAQDRDGVSGWIVDLRGNSGGNMWPMIAGLGPLLGEGTAGFFVRPAGAGRPWGYRSDGAFLDGAVQQRITERYVMTRAAARVAVLTDKATASSGEAVAVAFRGRPNTRSFGADTCGVPTTNSPFVFSDGSTLWLTTAVDADRSSRTYSGPIQPDELIADAAEVLRRAIEWIRGGLEDRLHR